MRFPNHVSVIWDIPAHYDYVPVTVGLHDHLIVVPPVATYVPLAPSVEPAYMPMIWPGGLVTGSHKFTSTVYHNHVWVALKGHDLGILLSHVSIPPNDTLMPIHILSSSRKATFGAGEVKANGKAIACCTMIDPPGLPTPMLVCGKVKVPVVGTGSAIWGNTLIVGQHWIDLAMGWAAILVNALLGFAGTRGGGGSTEPPDILGSLVSPGLSLDIGSLYAAAIGLAGQEFAGYHGDVGIGVGVGVGPLADRSVSLERSGEDGAIRAAHDSRLGPESANAHHHEEVRYHPDRDGNWVVDGGASGGVDGLGGGAGGGWSSDRGGESHDNSPFQNSPLSEGTSWGDLPLI